MSDSHEPSYYEIALTNRQVLIAFVILLVCLVAAFLSGVWVGHGDTPSRPERMAEIAPPGDEADGGRVERLSFFGGDEGGAAGDRAGAARAAPAGPRSDTTLAEDLEVAAEPAPAPRPPAASAPVREPQPRRAEPAPAPPPARDSAPAAAAPSGGEVVLQVFSSRDREQALKIVNRLQGGGRDAYLSPVEVDGETMFRVRLGPFPDRREAERAAEQIRREFRLDTWITPR